MKSKFEKHLSRFGYAAFIWSILFGIIHVYWALGGRGLFDGQSMEKGSLLYFINMVAIVLSFLAAILALAIIRAWVKKGPSWILLISAWAACIILGLRGSVGILQTFNLPIYEIPFILLIFEPLFLVGGLLFGAVAVFYTISPRRALV